MFEDQGWKPHPMPIPSARAASRRVWTAATAEYSLDCHLALGEGDGVLLPCFDRGRGIVCQVICQLMGTVSVA